MRKSIANAKGRFERVGSPAEAVDRLEELYEGAAQAMRDAVERFLKDREPPSAAMRALFRYPELRMIYEPNGPAPPNARAYAKFSEGGVYATTVTQPADFRDYLLEQLEPLVSEYGAAIEVGVGPQEIPVPVCDRDRRRIDARRRGRSRARALLPRSLPRHDRRRDRRRRVRPRQ